MSSIDIIILVCFLPAIYEGLTKGFISQAVSILSILLGAWLAFHFSNAACGWLSQYLPSVSPTILGVVGFILLFVIAVGLLNILGRLIEKSLKLALLGWLNRLLGIVFALAKGALIISLLIVLFSSLNDSFHLVQQETIDQSVLFQPLKDLGLKIYPYLKALIFKK